MYIPKTIKIQVIDLPGGTSTKGTYREVLIQRIGKRVPSFVLNKLLIKHNIKAVEINYKLLLPKKTIKILEEDILSNKPLLDKLEVGYSVDRYKLEKIVI